MAQYNKLDYVPRMRRKEVTRLRPYQRALALLIALLLGMLSGCVLQTVDELYCLPKRSQEYQNLQAAIDQAMGDTMQYCAPLSGENQQTVQMMDLDGDGSMEALLFASGNGEQPLKIFIFTSIDGVYTNTATLEASGTAFEQVEYADIDGKPGMELVVGLQVSNEVLHTLSVYSFASGQPKKLLGTSYIRFLTVNLDRDIQRELFVLRPGMEGGNGIAELYDYHDGEMERAPELAMSTSVDSLRRVTAGGLYGDLSAVFVASKFDENTIITDVYAMVNGQFTNVSLSNESGTSIGTVRNYYVYANDIDGDGLIELPELVSNQGKSQNLIRWYNLTPSGSEKEKIFTYHNYVDGWYVQLEQRWILSLLVERTESDQSSYDFSILYHGDRVNLFSVTMIRNEEFSRWDGTDVWADWFVLQRSEDMVYLGRLGEAAEVENFTPKQLAESFHFIRENWKTGET